MIKYIHIFFRDELKFNERVVKMVNDSHNGFNIEEHLFVTPFRNIYDELNSNYNNIELAPQKVNLLNFYSKRGKWIISHSFKDITTVLTANNKSLSKTIYRFWGGGDMSGYQLKHGCCIENIVKRVLNRIYRHKMSKLACIGIANTVDVIVIRRIFKQIPLMVLPYAVNGMFNSLKKIKESELKVGDRVNILLGHRGTKEDNHITILKVLRKFGDTVQIYVPLSYGDKKYIEEVKDYIETNELSNVHVLCDFMTYEEYARMLKQMDVAIFDGITSYALANISILLYFNKKIFLNSRGVIREAFDLENIPYAFVSDIKNMSLDDLVATQSFNRVKSDSLMSHDMDYCIGRWRELFSRYN